jgi:purine-binding chemotaxis protein CheW
MNSEKKNTAVSADVFAEVHKLISGLLEHRMTPEMEQKILFERAERLRKVDAVEETGEKIDLVIFQLANEYFGIEAQYISEIRPVGEITPVPCTPDFVLGITSVRGSIYSVLDIRKSFGVEDRAVTDESMFIVTSWKNIEVCILADVVSEKRSILKSNVKPMVGGAKNINAAYINGFVMMNQNMITLINWDTYVTQANVIVNEEV